MFQRIFDLLFRFNSVLLHGVFMLDDRLIKSIFFSFIFIFIHWKVAQKKK